MRRRRDEGSYIVTGPQERERRALNIGMGVSIALTYANHRRKEAGAFTYYVRDVLGTTTYATVTKRQDGAIEVEPAVAT
jgi:hypothetical protein